MIQNLNILYHLVSTVSHDMLSPLLHGPSPWPRLTLSPRPARPAPAAPAARRGSRLLGVLAMASGRKAPASAAGRFSEAKVSKRLRKLKNWGGLKVRSGRKAEAFHQNDKSSKTNNRPPKGTNETLKQDQPTTALEAAVHPQNPLFYH